MKIRKNHLVTILYTLKDSSGQVLEYSEKDDPLEYLHGNGMMLPGLENALEGCEPGAEVKLWLEPAEGFGERDENMIIELERADFGEDVEIEPGMEFDVEDEMGEDIITVISVNGDSVLTDLNHPLAGKKLYIEAEVLEVKQAEEWEIKGWQHHKH